MKVIAIVLAITAIGSMRADAKGCTEHSDVVGLQHCRHFGMWSRDEDVPRLWFEGGYARHAFTSQPFTLARAIAARALPATFPTLGRGFVLRGLGGIGHLVYVGVEAAIGSGDVEQPLAPAPSYSFYFAPNLIAGAHTDALGVGFAVELAAGYRYESFNYCPARGCDAIEVEQDRRVLEARAGIDLYLTSHWAVGMRLGRSLIDHDDTSFMVTTGIHLRAMDGM